MVSCSDLNLLQPAAAACRHLELRVGPQNRVVIIGDVHGCYDELRELLDSHVREDDAVVLAGDLVNKGPKSIEVLRLARYRGYSAVLGNHEFATLRGHAARRGGEEPGVAKKYEWTDGLTNSDLQFICGLPYTISIPEHNALVVHAGLVPGIPLDQQSPVDMVTMRNLHLSENSDGMLGPKYAALDEDQEGSSAWAALWSASANLYGIRKLFALHASSLTSCTTLQPCALATTCRPQHVFFGHDAKRRFQEHRFATGLDTGCVYGGYLTAAILEVGCPVRYVSVKAARRYQIPVVKNNQLGPWQKLLATACKDGKLVKAVAVALLACVVLRTTTKIK
eukprot:4026285-Pleurochrysis_carterae.AAC.5